MLYEGSHEASSTDTPKQGNIYSPRPIGNRNFVFRNETLATIADAEITYARLDERSTHSPYNSALRRMLANLEALATISVDGTQPDLETMLARESAAYAASLGYDTGVPRLQLISDKQETATKAAVAHFHLEAIRPFKTGMDRTGRAFVHMILRKRELYHHIIPPIALVPAINVPNHANLLFPYRTNKPFTEREATLALDRWTMHCANCMVLSVRVVDKLVR